MCSFVHSSVCQSVCPSVVPCVLITLEVSHWRSCVTEMLLISAALLTWVTKWDQRHFTSSLTVSSWWMSENSFMLIHVVCWNEWNSLQMKTTSSNTNSWPNNCPTVPAHKCQPPSPALDNIRVMVIVWRLRGNIIRTAPCWVVWNNVHSQQHTHMSSSYRSSRLGLSHWDPYAMHRGGCLELYYCNMVEWS